MANQDPCYLNLKVYHIPISPLRLYSQQMFKRKKLMTTTTTPINSTPSPLATSTMKAVSTVSTVSNHNSTVFQIHSTIDHGPQSTIYIASRVDHTDESTTDVHKVVVKKLPKHSTANSDCNFEEYWQHEIKMLTLVKSHPNIIQFHQAYHDENHVYIVMEYFRGCNLYHYLQDVGVIPEAEFVLILKQIVSGLMFCHELGIMHRDIKAENILIDHHGQTPVVKIIDFGLSSKSLVSRRKCGTMVYLPPQIVQEKHYDKKVDIWSLGVLTYEMLTGTLPFYDDNDNILSNLICQGKYEPPTQLSLAAQDLIKQMLQSSPKLRPSCDQILQHQFFLNHSTYNPSPTLTLQSSSSSSSEVTSKSTQPFPTSQPMEMTQSDTYSSHITLISSA
jgi:serine/threonine protein kinase